MDLRVAKCLLVAKVLFADGMMTENEHEFLANLMDDEGLDLAERDAVLKLVGWEEAEAFFAKLSVEERRELLALLVDASSADGRLSPLEMATVKGITAALGL